MTSTLLGYVALLVLVGAVIAVLVKLSKELGESESKSNRRESELEAYNRAHEANLIARARGAHLARRFRRRRTGMSDDDTDNSG